MFLTDENSGISEGIKKKVDKSDSKNISTINTDINSRNKFEFDITRKRESASILNWKYGVDTTKTGFIYETSKKKEFMKEVGPGTYNLTGNL